ncbi:MAG: NifB/NifX family molybdenum-iron cluster-binding protein [Prolixibacteraceae bacterium]|jgi:predicted Fe-Mo cluster-binding NifX family protein|nr:NifB/NifX family molybdenum-iron cluster-binding protein [Prolixibacteraceae bacterium]
MITIISAQENNTSSLMDSRFGRAKWFCIFNDENNSTSFVENPHFEAQGGAGVKTSEMIIELGAKKVISGHYGPKAKELLDKFNIEQVEMHEEKSIDEIIKNL